MNKLLLITLFLLLAVHTLKSQTSEQKSKPIAELFTDFHLNLNDSSRTTGFGLNRAYLGYNYVPEGSISGTVILNIGTPDDLANGSRIRRYAYFREASLSYAAEKLKISMGITSTRIFEFQQKFWGKRYIANTFQSINGYGFVADLGIAADIRFNDVFKADVTLMNGEGYHNVQVDNSLRAAAGLNITPGNKLSVRLYADIARVREVWQPMFIGFIGYRTKTVAVGAEATYKSNLDTIAGHHAWGLSATAALTVARNTEVFARYDFSTSRTMPDDVMQWNYMKDGVFLITGLQYSFSQNIKMALNYQRNHPYFSGKQVSEAILVNALFRF